LHRGRKINHLLYKTCSFPHLVAVKKYFSIKGSVTAVSLRAQFSASAENQDAVIGIIGSGTTFTPAFG